MVDCKNNSVAEALIIITIYQLAEVLVKVEIIHLYLYRF